MAMVQGSRLVWARPQVMCTARHKQPDRWHGGHEQPRGDNQEPPLWSRCVGCRRVDGVKDGENAADSIFFMGTVESDPVKVTANSYLAWKDFTSKDSIVVTGIVIEKQAKGSMPTLHLKRMWSVYMQGAADTALVSSKLAYNVREHWHYRQQRQHLQCSCSDHGNLHRS